MSTLWENFAEILAWFGMVPKFGKLQAGVCSGVFKSLMLRLLQSSFGSNFGLIRLGWNGMNALWENFAKIPAWLAMAPKFGKLRHGTHSGVFK